MNSEGMEDRYYFSDWGSCICADGEYDPECPLWESGEHDEEHEEDE
ncbi:MAG TPA: hypothetical protein VIY48_14465 [Candidatus Paceibacterota bacterium]